MPEYEDFLEIIKAHSNYKTTCECGEYLMKRAGPLSSREQYEEHLAHVIADAVNR